MAGGFALRSVGPDSWLWIVTALAAGAGTMSLWFGAARVHPPDRAAYRWLAVAALLWCAGAVGEHIMSGQVTGFTAPLTLADLFPLLALAPAATGVLALAIPRPAAIRGPLGSACRSELASQRFSGHVLDSYVMASALVVVGWLSLFASQYHRSAEDPQTFMLGLVRPVADILVVSALLPLVVAVGRRAAAPYLAIIAVTVGDGFGAAERLGGGHAPSSYGQIAKVVGYLLLLSAPWLAARAAGKERGAGLARGRPAAAIVSVLSAAVAALLIVVSEVAGGTRVEPVVIVVASGAVLALAGRVLGLLRENSLALAAARVSGGHIRELADRTSDAVLICDRDGAIRYASPSVAVYGYVADNLVGRKLAEFAHPEDRPAWIREIQRMAGDAEDDSDGFRLAHAGGQGTSPRDKPEAAPSEATVPRFPCRILAADGTWRHIECTMSHYHQLGERRQLLITARDLSDQVALRQQLTHLTFHDRLTGLANRAYFEERATEVLRQHRHGVSTQTDGEAAPAGEDLAADLAADLTGLRIAAIFLHLDHFAAVKDSAGHAAGDLLLTQAARRLRAAVPPQHTLARLGGDEFAVLVEAHSGTSEAVDLAEYLARCIAAQPFLVSGRDVAVTASVGVAFAGDGPAGDVMHNADMAMSRAKASGGGRVEVFAAHMHADVVRRLELSSDLQEPSPKSA